MKKLNKKGFTLIELLAVIVIMGILMLVAIPAMQRYIQSSKEKTYVNTVKEMVNAAKNAAADKDDMIDCASSSDNYYITIVSDNTNALDSKTKSPLNKSNPITAYIKVEDNKVTKVAATDGTWKIAETDVSGDLPAPTKTATATAPSSTCTVK